MKRSTISGIIRRRILLNYRMVPELIEPLLPPKLKLKLHGGFAMAGICLIRLEKVRPKGLPAFLGTASENAAHRVAVTWKDEWGKTEEGVYVLSRHTNSRLNRIAGGRLFPGEYQKADFRVKDDGDQVDFEMRTPKEETVVQVRGKKTAALPPRCGFRDLAEASAFFEAGSLGYSTAKKDDRLEGMRLKIAAWKIAPLEVEHLYSSFFGDHKKFPSDSIFFDCALIMRDIPHEWHTEDDLYL
jgi:hypothetical protein